MAFEDIKAEIALLLTQMAEQPHDRHELEFMVHGKLQELRAFGLPLPDDLVSLEGALDAKFRRDAHQPAQTRTDQARSAPAEWDRPP